MLNAVILKERAKDVTWKGSRQTFVVGRRSSGLPGSCWLQCSEKTSVWSRAQGRHGEGRWKKGHHLGWQFPGFGGKQGLKGNTVGEPHPSLCSQRESKGGASGCHFPELYHPVSHPTCRSSGDPLLGEPGTLHCRPDHSAQP